MSNRYTINITCRQLSLWISSVFNAVHSHLTVLWKTCANENMVERSSYGFAIIYCEDACRYIGTFSTIMGKTYPHSPLCSCQCNERLWCWSLMIYNEMVYQYCGNSLEEFPQIGYDRRHIGERPVSIPVHCQAELKAMQFNAFNDSTTPQQGRRCVTAAGL